MGLAVGGVTVDGAALLLASELPTTIPMERPAMATAVVEKSSTISFSPSDEYAARLLQHQVEVGGTHRGRSTRSRKPLWPTFCPGELSLAE